MACSAQHVANKVLSSYQWRLATKKYDPTKNVSDEDLDVILEAARLAPSSYGLEPWRFLVVNLREDQASEQFFALKRNFTSHAMVLALLLTELTTWLFCLLARTSTQSLLTSST